MKSVTGSWEASDLKIEENKMNNWNWCYGNTERLLFENYCLVSENSSPSMVNPTSASSTIFAAGGTGYCSLMCGLD